MTELNEMTATAPPEDMPLDERFRFGKNWAAFLKRLDDGRITEAEQTLTRMLGVSFLEGKSFLDIGCGSGLFSLCARKLGASVVSFDFDPDSVHCAEELRSRYFPDDSRWDIRQGSALDTEFVSSLGDFDVVYSWGVLHHTGNMWKGLGNAADRVRLNGLLYVAIYNDQGNTSKRWLRVKKWYNKLPAPGKNIMLVYFLVRIWALTVIRDLFKHGNPMYSWNNYRSVRGMNAWNDLVDWVGGYPFEVAKPEEIFDFYRAQGFELRAMKTCAGGLGCNEFVFCKKR
jgi:2-polyprenyl-6-hydroxyphenyl methylase/3-demethylubiquinone-9 3-methyltransferase